MNFRLQYFMTPFHEIERTQGIRDNTEINIPSIKTYAMEY